MRPIRVTLECGRPYSNVREWFSTIFLLSDEEIANGDHVAIARYRARIQGYVEPFELFDPSVARPVPSTEDAKRVGDATSEQPDVRPSSVPMSESEDPGQKPAQSGLSRVSRTGR